MKILCNSLILNEYTETYFSCPPHRRLRIVGAEDYYRSQVVRRIGGLENRPPHHLPSGSVVRRIGGLETGSISGRFKS